MNFKFDWRNVLEERVVYSKDEYTIRQHCNLNQHEPTLIHRATIGGSILDFVPTTLCNSRLTSTLSLHVRLVLQHTLTVGFQTL